ncbi:hypothetical protein P7K49_018071 [Saguinus oedipus]|uniref:Uncharacterized protein n=1 Tax=Saguinus oedipus TaxID=9490 RepID=A0ABQ9V4Z3_SAGOE|nr:hypothetical protein P7K49_018071 [Saguinus oedipus]
MLNPCGSPLTKRQASKEGSKEYLYRLYIRHPEELSLLKKPRDPTKKKKKKLDDQSEDEALELEGPLITPGSERVSDLLPVNNCTGGNVEKGCRYWWKPTVLDYWYEPLHLFGSQPNPVCGCSMSQR